MLFSYVLNPERTIIYIEIKDISSPACPTWVSPIFTGCIKNRSFMTVSPDSD